MKTGPAVQYTVSAANRHAHLFEVTLTVVKPAPIQRLQLPTWIPGSYLIREFARHLQQVRARQGKRSLPVAHIDKHTWDVVCDPSRPLTLHYTVYAFDPSVRTAWLDAHRGFFNATSLLLRVLGREDLPQGLAVQAPTDSKHWQLATSLKPIKTDKQGFGHYGAENYDELADSPVEMGAFWSESFVARGVPHRFVVAGAADSFDGRQLIKDARKICEASIDFWHGKEVPVIDRYVFMLNVLDDGYGGLEHKYSTALICNRRDLPRRGETQRSEGYTTLLGLISHEYFHTWNVKRLRPADLSPLNYQQENYTELLWFFEGFTSYYDDLLLRRAGLLDDATYLKLLTKTIQQVQQTPGRSVQSVAEASFDAWVKYYRQDENTPNATVSYYTKGALVALCLDLTLRSEGKTTLDEVMRGLWRRCEGGTMTQADLATVLQELGGRSYAGELRSWVHGTEELPLVSLLQAQGIDIEHEPAPLAQALGLRVRDDAGIRVKTVLSGGPAEQAGMAAGDEWLGIEIPSKKRSQPAQAWRLGKLEDLPLYAGKQRDLTAIVARDQRLMRLPLTLPNPIQNWRLAIQSADRVQQWTAEKK
ncbi:MAG: hypothetical protein RJA34_1964 [Pseudomonadota bacterium]|jgi:predicted metalloprotease with PDZ domain